MPRLDVFCFPSGGCFVRFGGPLEAIGPLKDLTQPDGSSLGSLNSSLGFTGVLLEGSRFAGAGSHHTWLFPGGTAAFYLYARDILQHHRLVRFFVRSTHWTCSCFFGLKL